jgi:hypothetical protein
MSRVRRLDLGDRLSRDAGTYPRFKSPLKLINTRTIVSVTNPELKKTFPSKA